MIDYKTCYNTVEHYVEKRYGMPVSIADVLDPNTGDFDGVSIKVDYDLDVDLAFYILLHLFGHSVQWNLSEEYRILGQDQSIPKPPDVMAKIHDYERDATRYSLTLCREAGVEPIDEIDRWVSDWFHADYAFLEHFYTTGERLDPKSLFQPGIGELLTPLAIPEFTPQQWTSRWSF
jgi:hypothetical protein